MLVLLDTVMKLLVRWPFLVAPLSGAADLRRSTATIQVAVTFSLARVRLLEIVQNLARDERLALEITLGVITAE